MTKPLSAPSHDAAAAKREELSASVVAEALLVDRDVFNKMVDALGNALPVLLDAKPRLAKVVQEALIASSLEPKCASVVAGDVVRDALPGKWYPKERLMMVNGAEFVLVPRTAETEKLRDAAIKGDKP